MLTMNEKDKNEMLEAILKENEAYQCKLWAVIMAGADTYALIGGLSTLTGGAAAALGALSNAYCYLGVTEKHLNMVIVNSVNVSKIENRLSLPLSSITKAEVKGAAARKKSRNAAFWKRKNENFFDEQCDWL